MKKTAEKTNNDINQAVCMTRPYEMIFLFVTYNV